jgi:drug/metabolite transporter (DMT)-like permease
MLKNTSKGIQFALIAALISGVSIFVNKFAVGAIAPPLVFTSVKNFGVGLLIISSLFLTRKWKLVKKLNRKEVFYLLFIGLVGGSIPFYLFFTGLTTIPAINAALIHKTLVFWVAIIALPTLKERLSKNQVLAIMLLFLSNLLVGGFNGIQFSPGELLVFTATFLWSVENVLAKKVLNTVDPDIVTAARMGFGSFVLLTLSLFIAPGGLTQITKLNTTQWFWMILTMTTLFGYVASWYRALKLAPATTVASVLVASTLVTNLLSAIFITHVFSPTIFLQTAIVVLGVWVFWWTAKGANASVSKAIS